MATAILPLISGLAGLFGGGTQQRQATSQTSSGSQSYGGTTTPNLNPFQQQLAQLFTSKAINFANQAPDLTGFTQSGIENINQANAGSHAATRNLLAARGLAYSPAYATAAIQEDQARSQQVSQFLSQIPLLQRQLQQQGIQGLEQAFQTQPYGQTSTGSQTSQATTQGNGAISGNPLAGLFSGVGAALGAPSTKGNPGNNLGDILRSLGFGGPQPQFNPGSGPGYGYG